MRNLWKFIAALALFLSMPTHTWAQTMLYDSGGFESSAGFALGDLHLQTGNQSTAQWFRDVPASSGGIPASVVSSPNGAAALYGSQVVSLNRSTLEADTRWYPNINNVEQGAQGGITVSWDMQIASAGITGNPVFGIEFNDYDEGARIGYVGVEASRVTNTLVVDNGSKTSAPGSFFNTNVPISPDNWHHYSVAMNFALQSYTVTVDGNLDATQDFEYVGPSGGPLTEFSDASLVSYDPSGAGMSSGVSGVAGMAYYDNYSVTESIPEPSFLGAFGTAGLLVALRGRTKSKSGAISLPRYGARMISLI